MERTVTHTSSGNQKKAPEKKILINTDDSKVLKKKSIKNKNQ